MKKNSRKQNRYLILDLIRCFAIGLVLFSHIIFTLKSPLARYYGLPNFYYVTLGGIGVTIMLILSGLVLELNYPKVTDYISFILKRLKRIYPVYILSFIFSLIYFLISTSFNCKICNLKNFILGISGFQAFFGEWGGPILRTGWFIGLVICLYLLFPLISYLFKKKPYLILLLTFMISFFSRLLLGKYDLLPYRSLDWFPLSRLFEFSLGIYAANVIPKAFWQIADKLQIVSGSVFFLSEISFPLFLIHYPLLNLINKFINLGLSPAFSVILYLFISFVLSWTINFVTIHKS